MRYVLVIAVVAGCGRIGFDELELGPVVALFAVDGTDVPAGALVTVQAALDPPLAGVSVVVTTDRGTLHVADGPEQAAVRITADAEGLLPPLRLRAPIDALPGNAMTLSTDLPSTGDHVYDITDRELVDAGTLQIVGGFEVQIVGQSPELAGRSLRIAFPSPESSYPAGTYVAAGGAGAPPVVVRFGPSGPSLFAESDGLSGPDEGVAQIAFAPPASAYGDRLFVCAASAGDGDGVFTVDPSGAFAPWADFNNCNGMVFDELGLLGDPGFGAPMYLNVNSDSMKRADPSGSLTLLTNTIPWGASGWKLYLHAGRIFPAGLYLFHPVDDAGSPNGRIWFAPSAEPWSAEPLVDPKTFPNAATFSPGPPFGDLLYVSSDHVEGIRPDLSTFDIVRGTGTADIAFGPDGVMWITLNATGQLLRLVPSD